MKITIIIGNLKMWIRDHIWPIFSAVVAAIFFAVYLILSVHLYILAQAIIILYALICFFWLVPWFLRGNYEKDRKQSILLAIFMMLLSTFACILCFSLIYYKMGVFYDEGSKRIQALLPECLYFSVVTWTTLGYGDYYPCGWSRFIASFEALIGYAVMGLIIGFIATFSYNSLINNSENN
ncbi:hypothetical protein GF312_14400 [Candidatus Poribacteria bacterium]|nr:hypothetical protein [Candidatus Poribacteria bacterium]